jgi:hypothetical protein
MIVLKKLKPRLDPPISVGNTREIFCDSPSCGFGWLLSRLSFSSEFLISPEGLAKRASANWLEALCSNFNPACQPMLNTTELKA